MTVLIVISVLLLAAVVVLLSRLRGRGQALVDTNGTDASYLVNDATGTGAGWHVTASATTFTNGTATLPDPGTFATNGSITTSTATSAPTAACSSSATCTVPTDLTTYPVPITTAVSTPLASTIYDAATGTGLGSITIGVGALPVRWWLTVPSNALVGTYTSTITLEVISGS